MASPRIASRKNMYVYHCLKRGGGEHLVIPWESGKNFSFSMFFWSFLDTVSKISGNFQIFFFKMFEFFWKKWLKNAIKTHISGFLFIPFFPKISRYSMKPRSQNCPPPPPPFKHWCIYIWMIYNNWWFQFRHRCWYES